MPWVQRYFLGRGQNWALSSSSSRTRSMSLVNAGRSRMRARTHRMASAQLAARPAVISASRVSRSTGPSLAMTAVRSSPPPVRSQPPPPHIPPGLGVVGDIGITDGHLKTADLWNPLGQLAAEVLHRGRVLAAPCLQGLPVVFRVAGRFDENPDHQLSRLDDRVVAVLQQQHAPHRALGEARTSSGY